LEFPCSETTQERSHLCLYLRVQVHCDSMVLHTRVVSFLLLIQAIQWWDKSPLFHMNHIQWDQIPSLLLILGMKHLCTKPTHLVDPQEDLFELLNVNTHKNLSWFSPDALCSVVELHSILTLKVQTISKQNSCSFFLYTWEIDSGRKWEV
jgi:hypothetical protein